MCVCVCVLGETKIFTTKNFTPIFKLLKCVITKCHGSGNGMRTVRGMLL